MAASFPTSVVNFERNNTNLGDMTAKLDAIYDEVEAVETKLGALGATALTATGAEINATCDLATLQAMTDDGAITIKNGIVTLNKGSAIAATLAAPAAADNGAMLTVYSLTAQAHTVTVTGSPATTGDDVATFTNTIGNSITWRAYNQKWYVMGALGVDVA